MDKEIRSLMRSLARLMPTLSSRRLIREVWTTVKGIHPAPMDAFGFPLLTLTLDTAVTFAAMLRQDRVTVQAILLEGVLQAMGKDYRPIVRNADILRLAEKMNMLREFHIPPAASHEMEERYQGLLMTRAEDNRVVMMLIVRSLVIMRRINLHPDNHGVSAAAHNASALYAPLAHRMGLYGIKSVLEDLSLKYTNRTLYKEIATRLNQTKRSRDEYIQRFIKPVKTKLLAAGLRFSIKGRTKSIASILHKIVTKHVDIDHIYDLFAIRVILDSSPERELEDCWTAYSILGDMYRPDPTRMRDWLTVPKENGYESLHITVLGPEDKWVEVQIRTRRMDIVAEKGLAAHWRYKGEGDVAADRIYAFTPKGDLVSLAAGSTLLDFAFAIHSQVGCRCTGGLVNGRPEKISCQLASGDRVNVHTSATQRPNVGWLKIVRTTKARNKIRQSLDTEKRQQAALGREMLMRRIKNHKMEVDEATLCRFVEKQGYSNLTDFLAEAADGKIDLTRMLAELTAMTAPPQRGPEAAPPSPTRTDTAPLSGETDLIIDNGNVSGLQYTFARCCHPEPDQEIFGFVSSDYTVKIHSGNCPNANWLKKRYPYRIIPVRWNAVKS